MAFAVQSLMFKLTLFIFKTTTSITDADLALKYEYIYIHRVTNYNVWKMSLMFYFSLSAPQKYSWMVISLCLVITHSVLLTEVPTYSGPCMHLQTFLMI